jgi:hypothetical protein
LQTNFLKKSELLTHLSHSAAIWVVGGAHSNGDGGDFGANLNGICGAGGDLGGGDNTGGNEGESEGANEEGFHWIDLSCSSEKLDLITKGFPVRPPDELKI